AYRLEAMDAIARMLLRGESLASSRIEGLRVSQRRLAEALFEPESADESAWAVIGNINAMDASIRRATQAPEISAEDINKIHLALLRHTVDAGIAGKLRDGPGWIGGADDSPTRAEYIPPPHEEVPALVDDLAVFINRTDMSPLVQAAIAHAQFELIHPFGDGNGRVGRCLIHVVLRRRGLATRFTPPISMILASDTRSYIGGLTSFREERIAAWCGVFAAAARESAKLGFDLVRRFEQLEARWSERAGNPRAHSTARKILQMLPARPVVDAKTVTEQLGVSEVAARNALNQLDGAGILTLTRVTRWKRAWAAREVFDLLNLFEKTVAHSGPGDRRHQAPRAAGRLEDGMGR
ncbi:MAG: Fic family protein, partial [Thermoplasmata archaeon]